MNQPVKKIGVSLWNNKAITLESLNLEVVLECPPIYEMGMVSIFDEHGERLKIVDRSQYRQVSHTKPCIQITGMENLSNELNDMAKAIGRGFLHTGPVKCTCFVSSENSTAPSGRVADEDSILYVAEGTLLLIDKDNSQIWVRAGNMARISKGTYYRMENRHANLIMLFECDQFLAKKYALTPVIAKKNRWHY